MNSSKKILYGICGIGNGHIFRQLPIVEHYAKEGHQLVIFGYDASFRFFSTFAKNYPNISVFNVEVPYYKGKAFGLDFEASAGLEVNRKDFMQVNCRALANAERLIGCPDLVISDYEPIVAQYAYAFDARLVTIDQQSKYLIGDFPESLGGQSYRDEVMRLRMFFPRADKRIACSFFSVKEKLFNVNNKANNKVNNMLYNNVHSHEKIEGNTLRKKEIVEIFPPMLREIIKSMPRKQESGSYSKHHLSVLVYFTAQQWLEQPLEDMLNILKQFTAVKFSIFLPKHLEKLPSTVTSIQFYYHGDSIFDKILAECDAVIATAGHSLLAECLYLNIPVFAMPLQLYEQQMNAYIVEKNEFGMNSSTLNTVSLKEFLSNLAYYTDNIRNDTEILLRNISPKKIIETIEI